MKYHANMEFRALKDGAAYDAGDQGRLIAVDFCAMEVELEIADDDYSELLTIPRRNVTLINHEDCSHRPCAANIERTAEEP